MRLSGIRPVIWIMLLGLLVAGCSKAAPGRKKDVERKAAPSSQAGGGTQTNEEGPVTVAVTWNGPKSGLVFRVAMNTHSADLDAYDLRKLAVLRTGDGREVAPSRWDAPQGGHHREGDLAFPDNLPDGTPVLGNGVRAITLVIKDVGGVPERRFQWSW